MEGLLKDLTRLEGLPESGGMGIDMDCRFCDFNDKADMPCKGTCKDAALRYIAKSLKEQDWVKLTKCENCKYQGFPHCCPRYLGGVMDERLYYCSFGEPREDE